MLSPKIVALSESQNHRCCYCGIVMLLDELVAVPVTPYTIAEDL